MYFLLLLLTAELMTEYIVELALKLKSNSCDVSSRILYGETISLKMTPQQPNID